MITAAGFPDLGGEGVSGVGVSGEGVPRRHVLREAVRGAGLPSEGVLGEGVPRRHVLREVVRGAGLPSEGVLGVGTDLVDIAQFANQLETAGSTFGVPGVFFASRELRRARERALEKGDSPAEHLAAVWAVKEAAIKAWVSALENEGASLPLSPEQVKWAQVTITHSVSGAPSLRLVGEMAEVFNRDFGADSADSADARNMRGSHEGRTKPDTRNTRGSRGVVDTDGTPDTRNTRGSHEGHTKPDTRNTRGSQGVDTDGTPPPSTPTWHVSASHDGAYAVGFVVLAR